MTAGLEVIGSAGVAQITSDLINFGYLGKVTLTPDGSGGTSSTTYALPSYVPVGTPVLIAYAAPTGTVRSGITTAFNNGGTPTVWVRGTAFFAQTLTAYLFVAKMPTTNNLGLEIYDATGAIAYTSAVRPLKIIDVISAPAMSSAPNSTLIGSTITSATYTGKTVAVIAGGTTHCYKETTSTSGPDSDGTFSVLGYYIYQYAYRISGSTVTIFWARNIIVEDNERGSGGTFYYVVDVGGY